MGLKANFNVFLCLALGNSAVSSSPPVVGGRNLFSNVTRLGFAAGHDSPSLNIQETNGLHNHNMTSEASDTTGNYLLIVSDVILYLVVYNCRINLLQCLNMFFLSISALLCSCRFEKCGDTIICQCYI